MTGFRASYFAFAGLLLFLLLLISFLRASARTKLGDGVDGCVGTGIAAEPSAFVFGWHGGFFVPPRVLGRLCLSRR